MVKQKILAVDDEEDILELLRFNLTKEGFAVVCAASGEEALKSALSNRPDLILLDLLLPGMGMNVGRHPEVPEPGAAPATCLLEETGQRVSRNDLLFEILTGFEALYRDVVRGSMQEIYEEWNRNCLILGKPVVIESDRERIEGKALRIDDCGARIIENAQGVQRRILAGDVSLRLAPS